MAVFTTITGHAMHSSTVTPIHPFQIIYEAAKQKDSASIKEILHEVCVDVEIGLEGTPVSQLAFEGNIQAVIYLQKTFNASSRWAIYGYGRSVNQVEAELLLEKAKSYNECFHLVRQYAKGLAVCNNPAAQIELKSISEKIPVNERNLYIDAITCGFILGRHAAPEIKYLGDGFYELEPTEVIHAKISAWTRTNRLSEVINYIQIKTQEVSENARDAHFNFRGVPESTFNYFECVNQVYYNLGRLGLVDLALNQIPSLFKDHMQTYAKYSNIVKGLGRGGYHRKALAFIKEGVFDSIDLVPRVGDSEQVILWKRDQEVAYAKRNKMYRELLLRDLIYGLAKGGFITEVKNVLTLVPPLDDMTEKIIKNFLSKGFLSEAREIVNLTRGNTWYRLMMIIFEDMKMSFMTNSFQRTALDLLTDWMTRTGSILQDFDYPEKFVDLKPKAKPLINIMHRYKLNFNQSLAWQDAVALQILLQLSRSDRISLESLFLIFDFLHPMTQSERQEVTSKYYFLINNGRFLSRLKNQAEFIPLIAASEQSTPNGVSVNGFTLFQMIKEKNLLAKAASKLSCGTEIEIENSEEKMVSSEQAIVRLG
jgi:hypothetical protein